MIPMVDLSATDPELRAEIEAGFSAVIRSGHFVLGPNVEAFEQEVAAYLGCRHAVSCASGTDALRLALHAAGIGAGDEVITSPFSFFASTEAICQLGATPVFADIDPRTFNLDPQRVRGALTPRTRALLPIHLFGQPADMAALGDIAEERGLSVIEDCAHAFGARRDGRAAGSFGLAGCFSFFPSKNLGAWGDGGLVCSDSDALADTLRNLRNHGGLSRGEHRMIGYNSRLDELQAVVLRAKLKRIDAANEQRRRIAREYNARLAGLPGITTPHEDDGVYHVYHQYTLLAENRAALIAALREGEIDCAVHYATPIHRQEALSPAYRRQSLPMAERAAGHCLSLPMFPELDTERIRHITDTLSHAL